MKMLLDTHAFLWFLDYDPRLSPDGLAAIQDPDSTVLVSAASLWEIAIKLSLGKLQIGGPFETFIREQLSINRVGVLNLEIPHLAAVSNLPLHHRDPFGRMIVAQALTEEIAIVSADEALDMYGITRLW